MSNCEASHQVLRIPKSNRLPTTPTPPTGMSTTPETCAYTCSATSPAVLARRVPLQSIYDHD